MKIFSYQFKNANLIIKTFILAVALLMLGMGNGIAASVWNGGGTGNSGGPWVTTTNWSPTGIPASGATITFNPNTSITINNTTSGINTSIATLTIGSTNTGTTVLGMSTSAITFTITTLNLTTGNLTLGGGGVAVNMTVSGGTIASGKTLTIGSGCNLTVSSGTLTVAGSISCLGTITVNSGATLLFNGSSPSLPSNVTVAAGGFLTCSGSGNVTGLTSSTINGTFTLGGSTACASGFVPTWGTGSTLVYGGSSAQTANYFEFGSPYPTNVTVSNSSGLSWSTSLPPNWVINGTLTLTSGVVTMGSTTFPTLTFQGGNTPIVVTSGSINPGTEATITFGTSGTPGGNAFTLPSAVFSSSLTIYNLTVNRTNALTLNSQNLIVSTFCNLNLGQVILGTGALTVNASSVATTGTFGTTTMFITSSTSGVLTHTFATGASSFNYPIGENVGTTEYNGFTMHVSANSTSRTVGWKVVDANAPSLGSPTDYISRYWSTIASVATGTFTFTDSLPYNGSTGDINGTESKMSAGYYNGSSWVGTGSVSTANHWLVVSGTQAGLGTAAVNYTGLDINCPASNSITAIYDTLVSNQSSPVSLGGYVYIGGAPGNLTGFIIFATTSNSSPSLVTGSSYSVGGTVGSAICIYKGLSTSQSFSSYIRYPWGYNSTAQGGTALSTNTFYWLWAFSYDSTGTCGNTYAGTSGVGTSGSQGWIAPNTPTYSNSGNASCNNISQTATVTFPGSPTTYGFPYFNGAPDQYNLVWNSAATTAGLVNQPSNATFGSNFTPLTGNTFTINIPAGLPPATYSGQFDLYNSTTGLDYYNNNPGAPLTFSFVVTPSVAAPTGSSPQYLCSGATVASLAATGTATQWYAAATGGSPLVSTATLTSGTIYYASQTVGGCESTARLAVTVAFPLSGTVYVGTGSGSPAYATLTGASGLFSDINAKGLSGNLTVLVQNSTTETGANVLNVFTYPCGGGPYTLTIQPAAATTYTISGTVATNPMISISGAKNVTINGNYSGSGQYLLFNNTNSTPANTGPTIQYNNSSSADILENCIIESNQTNATVNSGVVFIGATGSNAHITVSGNDIRSSTIGTMGAYSNGFYSSSANNSYLTITNNNFYQNTNATTSQNVIDIQGAEPNNVISGNYIGGSSAHCGGSAWTNTGVVAFRGMILNVGTSAPITTVDGNVIQNISMTNTAGSSFYGIYVYNASYIAIGATTGNTIGSTSSPASIQTAGTGLTQGIDVATSTLSNQTTTVSNNVIAGFTTSGATAFTGMYLQTNSATGDLTSVQGNTVQGITMNGAVTSTFKGININTGLNNVGNITPNTIGNSSNIITYSGTSTCYGIYHTAGASSGTSNLSNNIVSYISATSTSTTAQLVGIYNSSATFAAVTLSGNTVKYLTSAAANAGTGGNAAVIGVSFAAPTTYLQTVSNNIIHTLSNSNTGAVAVNAIGLYYNQSTTPTGTNLINANLIHSISLASTNTSASVITGLYIAGGAFNCTNNMIRLGIDSGGNAIANGYYINGIKEAAASSPDNYYFNSVYIGGSGVTSYDSTYAFNSAVTSGTRAIKDNIFYNARINTSGSGENYAIATGATAGLASDYNDLLANGAGAVLGNNAGTDYSTMTAWRTAGTGIDANSKNADPLFVNPTGTNTTVSLDIQPCSLTPIEGAGVSVAAVTTDFHGTSRALHSPTDIGADVSNVLPAATVSGGGAVCSGATLPNVSITFTGTQPWSLTYAIGGLNQTPVTGITSNPYVITHAGAGIYTVNALSDFYCAGTSFTGSATVTVNALPTVVASGAPGSAVCSGTSVTLYGSGATSYSWSGGITNSTPFAASITTTYTVTGTDGNNCTNTASTTVSVNPLPTVVANGAPGSAVCSGASVTLYGSGATSYSWTGGITDDTAFTVLTTTTYTVTGTDANACVNTATATVTTTNCAFTFTVDFFIQGYYLGGGKMSPLLHLLGASSPTVVDSVTIELRDSVSGQHNLIYSYTDTLSSNGTMVCTFPGADTGFLYIVIKHRNSIATWSNGAQYVSSNGSYDFTVAGAAYGTGSTVNLDGTYYGIYSGDINQDGAVDRADSNSLGGELSLFIIGVYDINDITGDGFVDEDDYRIMQNNIPLGITVQHP